MPGELVSWPMRDLGRRFQRLWLATAVSALGDGMLASGFQLLARRQTNDSFKVAAVYAIGRIPWAAALVLGSWVDRRNARSVLVGMDLVRATILGGLGALLVLHPTRISLQMLLATALILNTASVCFFCAAQRALPVVVDSRLLERANGLQEVAVHTGEQFVGPPLGGALFLGGKGPIIGDALSFAGSAVLLATLPSIPSTAKSGGTWSDIKKGKDFFFRSPILRSLGASISMAAFLQAYTVSTLVIMGKGTFKLSDTAFGLFLAAIAVGNLAGGFFAPRVVRRLGSTTIPAVLVVCGLCYLACVGSRSPVLVAMFLALEGVGIISANVFHGSARQRLVPAQIRGRVIGLSRTFTYGAQVPGALTAGVIARQLGTDWVFGIAGSAFVIMGLAIARPLRRTLRENPGWQAGSQPEVNAQAEVD